MSFSYENIQHLSIDECTKYFSVTQIIRRPSWIIAKEFPLEIFTGLLWKLQMDVEI